MEKFPFFLKNKTNNTAVLHVPTQKKTRGKKKRTTKTTSKTTTKKTGKKGGEVSREHKKKKKQKKTRTVFTHRFIVAKVIWVLGYRKKILCFEARCDALNATYPHTRPTQPPPLPTADHSTPTYSPPPWRG
eukprot:TRINITY_DN6016_c0_g1_i10.p2 TRINITY_DN6016_c0_g1~~TRINITY_DN6016_c0_g1_i10.p2  ORF type:complete len:131 (+),score=8.55 TRINITY_DN6016_c0_g1_i10:274-666(+)